MSAWGMCDVCGGYVHPKYGCQKPIEACLRIANERQRARAEAAEKERDAAQAQVAQLTAALREIVKAGHANGAWCRDLARTALAAPASAPQAEPGSAEMEKRLHACDPFEGSVSMADAALERLRREKKPQAEPAKVWPVPLREAVRQVEVLAAMDVSVWDCPNIQRRAQHHIKELRAAGLLP